MSKGDLTLHGLDGRTYTLPGDYADPKPETPPVAPPTARDLLARFPMGWSAPMPTYTDWSPQQIAYIQQLQQSILNLGGMVMNLAAVLNMALDQIEEDREREP